MGKILSVRACVHVCVRACMRACVRACMCHGPALYPFAFLTLMILTFDFDAHASCVADILHVHNNSTVQLGKGQPLTKDLRYTVYLSTKVLKWIAKN